MNLRTLKKLSKRALPYLELLDFKQVIFLTGPETSEGHTRLDIEKKHWERMRSVHDQIYEGFKGLKKEAYDGNGWIYLHHPHALLDGTVMAGWIWSGGDCDEFEETTAFELLKEAVENHFTDWGSHYDDGDYPKLTRRLDTPRQVFMAADEIVRKKMLEKSLGVAS